MEPVPAGPEERESAHLGRALVAAASALSIFWIAAGAAVWFLAVPGPGVWIGLGTGLAAAWVKVLHLFRWVGDSGRRAMPGPGGMLISIASFGASALLAGMHSMTAVAACLSTFAIPYAAVIMVSLKGRPG